MYCSYNYAVAAGYSVQVAGMYQGVCNIRLRCTVGEGIAFPAAYDPVFVQGIHRIYQYIGYYYAITAVD